MGLKPPVDDEVVAIRLPQPEGLNETRLKAAQSKLRRIANPIGLMLAEQLMAFDYGPHLLDHLNTVRDHAPPDEATVGRQGHDPRRWVRRLERDVPDCRPDERWPTVSGPALVCNVVNVFDRNAVTHWDL